MILAYYVWVIAKKYLNEDEIKGLNRIVTMYLDYAEDQAKRHRQIIMRDWREKLDAFLKFNERDILEDAGKVAKEVADKLALEQYGSFDKHRLAQEAEQEALADDEEYEKYLTEQSGKGGNDFEKAVKKIEVERKGVKEKKDG